MLNEHLSVLDEDPHLGIDQLTPDPISELLVGNLRTGIAASRSLRALLSRRYPDEARVDCTGHASVI